MRELENKIADVEAKVKEICDQMKEQHKALAEVDDKLAMLYIFKLAPTLFRLMGDEDSVEQAQELEYVAYKIEKHIKNEE